MVGQEQPARRPDNASRTWRSIKVCIKISFLRLASWIASQRFPRHKHISKRLDGSRPGWISGRGSLLPGRCAVLRPTVPSLPSPFPSLPFPGPAGSRSLRGTVHDSAFRLPPGLSRGGLTRPGRKGSIAILTRIRRVFRAYRHGEARGCDWLRTRSRPVGQRGAERAATVGSRST